MIKNVRYFKAEEQVCQYHLILEHLLDIGMLTRMPINRMLPLHDIALDDIQRPRHRVKNCHTLYTTKTHFLRLQTTGNGKKYIYSYIIKGLLH